MIEDISKHFSFTREHFQVNAVIQGCKSNGITRFIALFQCQSVTILQYKAIARLTLDYQAVS